MTTETDQAIEQAKAFVRSGAVSAADALKLEKPLARARNFHLARRLLDLAQADPHLDQDAALRQRLAQRLALFTYKDPDLPDDQKLDDALAILRGACDLTTTQDQESLGLAGAILRRQWQITGKKLQLERSLALYLRGYRLGIASDAGYTAINAAFALDALADLESADDGLGSTAEDAGAAQRRRQAQSIREEIVAEMDRPGVGAGDDGAAQWWVRCTVGEAHFGLGHFESARTWFAAAVRLDGVADWQIESTARQVASLLHLMRRAERYGGVPSGEAARAALAALVGADDVAALESVDRGRVGLGMSGGGFRASLYHIGVLARLAELDLLRQVEYLSCVSGGSIIGAHYYLEVRHLLQTRVDAEITRQDYIDIVARIERQFLAGVQTNIRVSLVASWLTNLKMIFESDYSRTRRIGDLYESKIFARIPDDEGGAERWLNGLTISPLMPGGSRPPFSPKDGNWRRRNKVPILVLNATSLNTGHNWQFTATWMGESPARLNSEIDTNYRLRRIWYRDLAGSRSRVRLGHAVAASACVPGLFDPLSVADIYERRPSATKARPVRPVVRLVDGGVHDNQGIAALLEQDCKVLLISDASGQMADLDDPDRGMVGVPLRAQGILQARIRVSEYEDLCSRRGGGLLAGLMFVHLKKDLGREAVDWIGCEDPSPPLADYDGMTAYGIRRPIQRLLAGIRTDLDSFTEVEAFGLMTSGYQMASAELAQAGLLGFPVEAAPTGDWHFLRILPLMQQSPPSPALVRQLGVASVGFFKVWLLTRWLKVASGVAAAAAVVGAGIWAWAHWTDTLLSLSVHDLIVGVVIAGLPLLGLPWIARALDFKKNVSEMLLGVFLATFGWAGARLHLLFFDKLFLSQGRLARLLGRRAGN
jgi:predicted acylesterase/phospholipase RssA